MPKISTVNTKNGFKMPIVGFGTWQATEGELEAALDCALEAGYRHIDTAFIYLNEDVIGKVLQKWFSSGKLKREDLFIVTKLPNIGNRPEHVEMFLDLSLKRLQLDYVDLYLIHTPFGLNYIDNKTTVPFRADGMCDIDVSTDLVALWKKMEEQVDSGKTRWIGVSNFNVEQVGRLLEIARIPPATNQIQLYAYLQQPELVRFLQTNDIVVTSYSTLGSYGTIKLYNAFGVEKEMPKVLENEVVVEISKEVGKSPAQVLLRHMMQKNIVVIPKSINPDRIQQNFDLFDFELSDDQMKKIDQLDENLLVVDFCAIFKGVGSHPEYPF